MMVLSAMSAAELCWGHMQGVAVMANILLDMLRNSRTPPSEATDACKHLLQLQAEGSPCMEHCAPVQLYLTTQVLHSLWRDCRICLLCCFHSALMMGSGLFSARSQPYVSESAAENTSILPILRGRASFCVGIHWN